MRNLSELPAVVSISFNSKVLSLAVPQRVVTIAPRQAHELRFDFVPRRVNPAYRKQVTITNLKNEGDEHLVEFVANNVDRHNISFHSLFYTLVRVRLGLGLGLALTLPPILTLSLSLTLSRV